MKTIPHQLLIQTAVLGYTLTECYIANANYNGFQKQVVIKVGDTLIPLSDYLNGPSDAGRNRSFIAIKPLTESQYMNIISLKEATNERIAKYRYNDWTAYDLAILELKDGLKDIIELEELQYL